VPARSFGQDDGDVDVSAEEDVSKSEYEEETDVETETSVDDEQQQMYVMPAEDVTTWVQFLGVQDNNKFIAGDEVTALIGMHNSGSKTYNVSYSENTHGKTAHTENFQRQWWVLTCAYCPLLCAACVCAVSVGAHLHSPYDQSFYVQNFTVRYTSALLPPRSEVTLEYRFRPDERLDALDYHLSGWLIYNDSSIPTPIIYRSLFVNATVETIERRAEWTAQSALAWAVGLAGVGVVAYAVAQSQGGAQKLINTVVGAAGGKKAKKSRSSATASTAAVGADGEPAASPSAGGWEVKAYRPATVQKAVGGKKHQKPSNKDK